MRHSPHGNQSKPIHIQFRAQTLHSSFLQSPCRDIRYIRQIQTRRDIPRNLIKRLIRLPNKPVKIAYDIAGVALSYYGAWWEVTRWEMAD